MSIDLQEWSARARAAMKAPDDTSFASVAVLADRLLAAPDAEVQSPDGIECLLNVCRAMHALGHSKAIVDLAARALFLARRENAHVRRSLTLYGVVMADAQALAAATEAYAETIEIARASGDQVGEAGAWNNLGALLLRRGQHRSAEPMLVHAGEFGRRLPATNIRSKALINLAEGALRMGQVDQGLSVIHEVLREITSTEDLDAAVTFGLGSAVRARLLARCGRTADALGSIGEARARTAHAGSALINVSLDVAEGVARLRGGEAEAGACLLHDAIRRAVLVSDATAADSRAELIEALRAVGNKPLARQETRAFVQERARIMYERTAPAIAAAALREGEQHRRRAEQMLCAQAVDAETAEDELGYHPYRVGRLAARTAAALGLDGEQCAALERAGRLHDLGKAAIPSWLLLSEALDLDELAIVRSHAELTTGFLERCGVDRDDACFKAIEQVHERVDGRGYPGQLAGDQIGEGAKVVAVCEAFDAMTHHRAGRPLRTPQAALDEMRRCAGTQFDGAVVEAFVRATVDLPQEVEALDQRLAVESGADQDGLLRTRARLQALLGSAPEPATAAH